MCALQIDPLTMGDGLISPDGKKTAFVRDHNLWIRDHLTSKEQALTHDGVVDNTYGMRLGLPKFRDYGLRTPSDSLLINWIYGR